MQCSAKAGVLLAVLRRCDVAWKKQQQGGIRVLGQLVPRFRTALAASLPCPFSILVSYLRTIPQPLSLFWAGFHPLEAFLPGSKPLDLAGPVSSRGLPWLRQVPHWSSAAIRRDSGQSPPIPRSGHSIFQGESFLHCSPTPSSDLCRVLEEEPLLPSLATPNTHSSRAHLGRLLTQKGRSPKAGFLGHRTSSPSGIPTLQASLRQGGIRTGRRSTTDFSPRENPSCLLGSECRASLGQPGCEAAWHQLEGEPRGSQLPGWPPAGPIPPAPGRGGVRGPLPIAPGSGRDSAPRAPRSAPRGWT